MKMPDPEKEILDKLPELTRRLVRLLGKQAVISSDQGRKAFESDGLTAYRQSPMIVALPGSTKDVSEVLKICNELNIKVVPRGAGTSLSGGALPLEDGLTLGLSKLNKIIDIDYQNRCVVSQCGVTNLAITHAVEEQGFYYAPDPSSQIACTIGGNVAENSGGVHCLKYGLTTNNILGLKMVLMNGDIIELGGKHMQESGYDLIGLITGSEGLLGVVTEATLRILPKANVIKAMLIGFDDIEKAGECVASTIASGIIPAGMEMMDNLAINAAEDYCHPGYPRDAAAILIAEFDGVESEVDYFTERVSELAKELGATSIAISQSEEEKNGFWAGRKAAFPAVGRISPDYYCMDGSIPRKKLPIVLRRMNELSKKYGLRVANVFHAGDGNLHPLILYDANVPGELERAEEFGADILRLCVEVGGALTGEHGIGVEKRDLMPAMFTKDDLNQQERIKCAFDPAHRLNPGKMFPELHRCAELGKMHIHGGKLLFPDIPRF
ncbi:MAG TPA: FAD-linked oxidase C-terminal domain-containing protein [Emcibacteraceae bacterium]|nr:FAD-linked oxidase C-terminal domain-containing protein [Emcibacteraceae bacterium]